MDIQSAIVTSFVEFYSAEEIRGFWKQALDALTSRSTSPLTINATGFSGQTSSAIVLNTPDEIANFITACQSAIKKITGVTTVDPSNLGTPVSFAHRILQA